MFTLEGREMLSGKLKGMGGFSGKENNTDLLHLLMEVSTTCWIFCCCSFNPYNAAIVKGFLQ
jgi:hypothetical protein